jgi:hypothetical protein
MTFDPKSLLIAPALTVDGLAVELAKASAAGMGGAPVKLPDGQDACKVELVAAGEVPAHFVVRGSK